MLHLIKKMLDCIFCRPKESGFVVEWPEFYQEEGPSFDLAHLRPKRKERYYLNFVDIKQIKHLLRNSDYRQKYIAKAFNVSESVISKIKTGESYEDIPAANYMSLSTSKKLKRLGFEVTNE